MPPSSSTTQLSPAELSYLHTSLSSHPPIRPDARLPTDFRPFSAETNILPNTYGSAHVGFADGREAVVGIRAEVAKTPAPSQSEEVSSNGEDVAMAGADTPQTSRQAGKASWVNLSLTLPGLRDDDKDLVFLEEMLREVLVLPSSDNNDSSDTTKAGVDGSLQDALVINSRWHWRLHIDVVLISPPSTASGSYPLPLLSMAVHLALRDTRIPRLKSEGEEDPLADDDWEASVYLYDRKRGAGSRTKALAAGVPPVTLLIMVVGENVIFDPDGTELAVADGVFAVSIGRHGDGVNVLGLRMLETSARDTFKGIPKNEGGNAWEVVPGVWRPKVGGVKRAVLTKIVNAVLKDAGREVLNGLEAFVVHGG